MRFFVKIGLFVLFALVLQMSTDVTRIAWQYSPEYCYAPGSNAEQATAYQAVEADFKSRCAATRWVICTVMELPLDQAVLPSTVVQTFPNEQ